MFESSDTQLLRDYAEHGNEEAFRAIVTRHADLVYSAALRQVDSADLAGDVAQTVFSDLARKASQLSGQMVEGRSLAGWLYRSTRFASLNQRRRDQRRVAREREAMEQLPANSETVSDWERVCPILDEAMAELTDDDRDALLLRFFKQQSLREVGMALGLSEDAAQKRVSRAVERLREFFAGHGVNVGASGLAAVIAANAVQGAPAGLVAAISAAATSAMTEVAASSLRPAMGLTKTKLMAAGLVAAVAVPLALLCLQNAAFRREIAALRAAPPESPPPVAAAAAPGKPDINDADLQRLRKEHLELLSLRGRVTQLANELRRQRAGRPGGDLDPAPASQPQDADSILFSASVTNRVESGQTLVLGGWSMRGLRGYLLVTPAIRSGDDIPDGKPLRVESQVVGAPEEFWHEIGWAAAKSDTRRSTLASVLSSEQADMLRQALKETKDSQISNGSVAERRNGEYVGIGFSLADDQETGALMGIEIYPWIAADGQSVDLEIHPSAVSTNTPIHSSLR